MFALCLVASFFSILEYGKIRHVLGKHSNEFFIYVGIRFGFFHCVTILIFLGYAFGITTGIYSDTQRYAIRHTPILTCCLFSSISAMKCFWLAYHPDFSSDEVAARLSISESFFSVIFIMASPYLNFQKYRLFFITWAVITGYSDLSITGTDKYKAIYIKSILCA